MYGAWTVSTNGPATLYLSNAPGATGIFGYPPRYDEVRRMALDSNDPGAVWLGELRKELAADPGALARVMGRKAQLLLDSYDAPDNGNYYFARRYVLSLRYLTFGPLFLYVVGGVGAVLTWRQRRRLMPLYVAVVSLAVTLLIFHVAGRFKLPILAMLGVLGAGALPVLWRAGREQRWRVLVLAALAAILGTLAFWPRPPFGLKSSSRDFRLRPQEFVNHSVFLLRQARSPEAVALMKDAARLFPNDPRFYERLAAIALNDGRYDAALRYADSAVGNGQRTQRILRRRVEALAGLNRTEEAKSAAAQLLRLYPDASVSPEALRSLRGGRGSPRPSQAATP
jgi:tetratricopeptide (TPR) repeat protein